MDDFKIIEIPVKLDKENIREKDIGDVLKYIKPDWIKPRENWKKCVRLLWKPYTKPRTTITVSNLHDSLHNKLLKITKDSSEAPEDILVCKIFHENSKHTVDHDLELFLIQHLNSKGCFMPVFCRFENGYVYQYAEGEHFFSGDERNKDIILATCNELHRLHSIPLPKNLIRKPFRSLDSYLYILQGTLQQARENQYFECNLQGAGMNQPVLLNLHQQALRCFETLVSNFDGVICHNDVNYYNIVHSRNGRRVQVKLIDFERLSFLPEIIDLAMMCTRTRDTGHGLIAPQNWPPICSDLQLLDQWVRIYLESHPKYHPFVTDTLVNKWKTGIEIYAYFVQIMDLFICLSHHFVFRGMPVYYLQRAAEIYQKLRTESFPDFKL